MMKRFFVSVLAFVCIWGCAGRPKHEPGIMAENVKPPTLIQKISPSYITKLQSTKQSRNTKN